ncbi:hypothetical protein ES708_01056 [subsurface metagenome]
MRDAIYKVSSLFISYFWGEPYNVAIGVGALLLTWNRAFYRFGSFDFDKLENCIATNFEKLNSFRNRYITSLSKSDDKDISCLFKEFLEALQIDSGKYSGRKSPVGVSKALHLLAPSFFPIWDNRIARAYGYNYYKNPEEKYVLFCRTVRTVTNGVKDYINYSDKTIIKLLDEYNYSKYTGGWI